MMKYIKKITIFTFAMLMFTLSILGISSEKVEAYSPPTSISGSAYVSFLDNGNNNPALAGTLTTRFNVTMPDGKVYLGYCLDPGKHAPVDGTYNFTGALQGDGSYYITLATSYYASSSSQISHAERHNFLGAGYTQRVGFAGYRPPIPKGSAKLKKAPASNTHLINHAPEHYSLDGTQYYVYSDANLNNFVGHFDIDANGDSNTLNLNAGRYYIKETAAGKGYKLDTNTYILDVKPNETTVLNVTDEPKFDPLSLIIEKKSEEGTDSSLSVEGAEYSIDYYKELEVTEENIDNYTPYRHWVFRTDANGEIRARDRWRVGGDELFKEEDGTPVGLIGVYVVREVLAPMGFARTEGIVSLQKIENHHNTTDINPLKNVVDIEKPQTISIEINKKDSETLEPKAQGYGSLEGARYDVKLWDSLTNTFTKVAELITDINGYAKYENGKPGLYEVVETESSRGYILDKAVKKVEAGIKEVNTANFNYIVESLEEVTAVVIKKTTIDKDGNHINLKGAIIELLDDMGNVVEEFTTTSEPYTIKGLTKDKVYRLREKKSPTGYFKNEEVFSFSLTESSKGKSEVEIFNEPVPNIKTIANFDNNLKETAPAKKITVIDKVSYNKLLPNKEYTLKGRLVDKDNPNIVIATGEKTFIPTTPNGFEYISFTFDGSLLEGKTMVVFEDLYKNGKKLVSHADITDKEQTVKIPKVRTTAFGKDTLDKDAFAGVNTTIVDIVKYSNLTIGNTYTIKGVLMDKETNAPLLDFNGNEIRAEKTFTAIKESGEERLEFIFNASLLVGKTTVVFEDLYKDGKKVGSHADITDNNQTINFPKVKTTAMGKDSKDKNVLASENVTIIDTIKYEKLIAGRTYTVKGLLMDKETNKPLIDSDGKEVRAEKTFVASKPSGSIELEFTFNSRLLAGKVAVVFEDLYRDGKKVATHSDINDKEQSVYIPKIKTSAVYNTGDKVHGKAEVISIIDTISYNNLIGGRTYTIKGRLMDKKTGKAFIDGNGNEVVAIREFTAREPNGSIELRFTFNGLNINEETDLVVFEEIYLNGVLIAQHKDIEDREQTIKIIPKKNEPVKTADRRTVEKYIVIFLFSGIFILGLKRKRNT